jgi:hypothetical protein
LGGDQRDVVGPVVRVDEVGQQVVAGSFELVGGGSQALPQPVQTGGQRFVVPFDQTVCVEQDGGVSG